LWCFECLTDRGSQKWWICINSHFHSSESCSKMNLVFPFYQKLNLMKYSKDLIIILPSFGTVEHQKKVPVSKSNTRLLSSFFCCRDIKNLLSSNALLNGDRFLNLPCNPNAVLSHPSTYRSLSHTRASSALSYVTTWPHRSVTCAWTRMALAHVSPPRYLSLARVRFMLDINRCQMDITIVISISLSNYNNVLFFRTCYFFTYFFPSNWEKNKQQKQTNSIITTMTNMPSQNYTRIVD